MGKREEVVALAKSWIGLNESDGSYKKILDIYNSQKNLPRGTKMKRGMSWCAATWSALAVQLGYTDIMPVEVSCGQLIEKAKNMGIWKEADNYIPNIGDAILYDWGDPGKGDCVGWPDHIGIVKSISKTTDYMTIIEGNYQHQVKMRKVKMNSRYVRGFIAPKYEESEKKKPVKKPATKPVKKEPVKKVKEVKASKKPMTSERSIIGDYRVNASNLRIRDGAATSYKVLCIIPKNTIVSCLGKRTSNWLFVQFTMNGILYKGFAYRGYLKKV